jgi:hypothetical protein
MFGDFVFSHLSYSVTYLLSLYLVEQLYKAPEISEFFFSLWPLRKCFDSFKRKLSSLRGKKIAYIFRTASTLEFSDWKRVRILDISTSQKQTNLILLDE